MTTPLVPGTSVGPYVIAEKIGAGGMGEVFRAQDVNLGRAAAIKVLPASLAGDPERLARFEREAQTLASLNHPNIAQVFGLEKGSGEFRAIAMEFVDGPTLAERIAGPMPLDDAIPIALQIAEALESAHDHGIIHRDLKPANIKVRPDGTVKVLDFGLAKAVLASSESTSGGISHSPTITSPAMTHAGVILGTAAYMSPEQAKGRVVDRRADIWAFGCVLFEMLSGKRAFAGGDVSDLMVSILRDDPQWSALPASTPPHVTSLLQRCLQKDVKKRLPHIGVARLELAEPPAPVAAAVLRAQRITGFHLAAIAIVSLALGVPAGRFLWSRPAPTPAPSLRLSVELGTAEPIALSANGGSAALSPDGRTLAFVGRPPTSTLRVAIFVRSLDRLESELVPGSDGGQMPFFSPDGRWIAFFAGDTLKKVAVNGGPVVSICPAPSPRGGWWGDDDVIVFAAAAGLSRVSAGGGTPAPVPATATNLPSFPQVLPRGRGILYGFSPNSDAASGSVLVQDVAGGAPKEILQGGRFPRYLSTGHLTFVRRGTLFAVPFDLDRLAVTGEPVPVVERVFQSTFNATPDLAISANGILAYQSGAAAQPQRAPILWLSQAGPLTPLRETAATFAGMRFSPDGKRLAIAIADDGLTDIWVYDWERDILTRITSDPAADVGPVWTPDGTGLVFGRGSNTLNLFWQRADGTGTAVQLTNDDVPRIPNGFDPSGRTLVYHEGNPATNRQSIGVLPIERDAGGGLKAGTPALLIGGPFLKSNARISPDGKWIAYTAFDTGTFEIYVQPFPGLGNRVQVSSGGGGLAAWSRTKNELYYVVNGQERMMVAPYTVTDGVFVPEKPRPFSDARFSPTPPIPTYGPSFDLHPDGRRFAVSPVIQAPAAAGAGQLVLLVNFFDELRRLAPTP